MKSEWYIKTVGDVAIFDNRLRVPLSAQQRAPRHGPYPYWGANGPLDMVNDYIFDGPRVLVAEDGNTVVRPDGSGTVHLATGRYWVNNHAHVLRAQHGHDLRWLFYALSSLRVRDFVTGSAQPKLSMGSLKRIPLAVPPNVEQRRIASALGALDDKIVSNARLAGLIEETAATIFRARFIDFTRIEEFEESKIGRLPKGWSARRFSEVIEINPRVSIQKGTRVPFIEMAALSPWATRPNAIGERSYSGGARFEPGDTLMARITGCIEHGKGAYVDFLTGPAAGSTEFIVMRAKYPLTPEAVFLLSRVERVRSHAIASMTGSSGRQRVTTACFDDLMIATPPDLDCWLDDANFIRAGLAKSRALWSESRSLAAIRDALLPRLISGQIRVPDTTDPEEIIGPASEDLAGAAR